MYNEITNEIALQQCELDRDREKTDIYDELTEEERQNNENIQSIEFVRDYVSDLIGESIDSEINIHLYAVKEFLNKKLNQYK